MQRTKADTLDALRTAAAFVLAIERRDAEAIVALTIAVPLPDLVLGLSDLAHIFAGRVAELTDMTTERLLVFTAERLATLGG